ncbi:hypothetical protein EJ05DRAFT_507343 [Pseudovirgaria hyperparasitica]|uniref:Uncharacterized protein n=1 Tax=Pseudovirgaria hyperparasitica TaxID=470096 RepID=A0A6A6WG16_9PEZI|nr:uncharacterized protein EJ05DRAFT_507343 [Pseudovirgaria hyperparasitica]KAF2761703.1 hypothetical protein EJ05DRAFT_507343 [Pseudovirgaria hyperparasitica]
MFSPHKQKQIILKPMPRILQIRLMSNTGSTRYAYLPETAPLSELMEAWCTETSTVPAWTCFFHGRLNTLLAYNQTAASARLCDLDTVKVDVNQAYDGLRGQWAYANGFFERWWCAEQGLGEEARRAPVSEDMLVAREMMAREMAVRSRRGVARSEEWLWV